MVTILQHVLLWAGVLYLVSVGLDLVAAGVLN